MLGRHGFQDMRGSRLSVLSSCLRLKRPFQVPCAELGHLVSMIIRHGRAAATPEDEKEGLS